MTKSERWKKMYDKRKENGLCTKCGSPLDEKGIHCSSCREKINAEVRESRKWLQENGICPRCRKNKLYGDEKNCVECRAYQYLSIVPKREEKREHYNELHKIWSKKTHHEMIEKGICTRCRKRKADNGYKTCGICRNRERNYKREKYGKPDRSERTKDGICYFCENQVKVGYKVCEKHYQMNIDKANCQKAKEGREKFKKIMF